MASMKPYVIRYAYIDNELDCSDNLKVMGIKKFGEDFKGFIKISSWINSEGYVSRKLEPIKGTPAQSFRNAIEDAGLVGLKF